MVEIKGKIRVKCLLFKFMLNWLWCYVIFLLVIFFLFDFVVVNDYNLREKNIYKIINEWMKWFNRRVESFILFIMFDWYWYVLVVKVLRLYYGYKFYYIIWMVFVVIIILYFMFWYMKIWIIINLDLFFELLLFFFLL